MRKRVLVVGGGFGGMYCARRLQKLLKGETAEIVVVNPENYMLYTPILPEAASGVIEPRHVVVPLRRVLKGCRLILGRVSAVDLEHHTATISQVEGAARTIAWDRLVLAPGSVPRVLPIPGLAEYARGFKTLSEGIYLRNQVLQQLELADASDDPAERACRLTFVVVGAGYAGTELVAELQSLTRRALSAYPLLKQQDLRWMLVDVAPKILPELGQNLGERALKVLRKRGVEIRLQTTVEEVGPDWVRFSDGDTVRTKTFVWSAGVAPDPLVSRIGLETDQGGRLVVDEYLQAKGRDDVFALGDAAAVPDPAKPGSAAPPTAQHALREAKACAANVAASLGVGKRKAFSFRTLGLLVNLSDFYGVGRVLGLPVRGVVGWFVTRTYHLGALPSLYRKSRVLADWTVALAFPNDIVELGSLGRDEALPGTAPGGLRATGPSGDRQSDTAASAGHGAATPVPSARPQATS